MGVNAGGDGPAFLHRATIPSYFAEGFPDAGTFGAGLLVSSIEFADNAPLRAEITYTAANYDKNGTGDGGRLDFAIIPAWGGVECPRSAGWGRFRFSRLDLVPFDGGQVGEFEFHCPDAGIDVQACLDLPR